MGYISKQYWNIRVVYANSKLRFLPPIHMTHALQAIQSTYIMYTVYVYKRPIVFLSSMHIQTHPDDGLNGTAKKLMFFSSTKSKLKWSYKNLYKPVWIRLIWPGTATQGKTCFWGTRRPPNPDGISYRESGSISDGSMGLVYLPANLP